MNKLIWILVILGLAINAYWTNRLYKFAKQQMAYNDYLDDKSQCSLVIGSGVRYDLARGIVKQPWTMYDQDIPACLKYYSRHMCWVLNVKDDVSLDKCGENFGFTKDQIEAMKKTHVLLPFNEQETK